MKILMVAGGDPRTWPALTTYDYYCGIDRGCLYLLERGLPLDLAVGDFDSLQEGELAQVETAAKEIHRSQPEKDDTDTQLALVAILQKFPTAEIWLIGATGGRLDHLLANLWLPLEPRFKPFAQQLRIVDQQNFVQFLLPGSHTLHKVAGMKYLGYCPLTPVRALTLAKSKYTLEKQAVPYPYAYASNEFVGDLAEITFTDGVVAAIQSKD